MTLDSYYVLLLMDYGFLGFILYMGVFLRASWLAGSTVVKHRPTGELLMLLPFAVALMNFIVAKLVFVLEANHPIFFMILGASLGLTWRVLKGQGASTAVASIQPARG